MQLMQNKNASLLPALTHSLTRSEPQRRVDNCRSALVRGNSKWTDFAMLERYSIVYLGPVQPSGGVGDAIEGRQALGNVVPQSRLSTHSHLLSSDENRVDTQ